VIGPPRSTQRRVPQTPEDEARLTADIIALATPYGRYGYRRITALLHQAGWTVNRKRVEPGPMPLEHVCRMNNSLGTSSWGHDRKKHRSKT